MVRGSGRLPAAGAVVAASVAAPIDLGAGMAGFCTAGGAIFMEAGFAGSMKFRLLARRLCSPVCNFAL